MSPEDLQGQLRRVAAVERDLRDQIAKLEKDLADAAAERRGRMPLKAELAKADAEVDDLKKTVRELVGLVESGALVRNTTKDSEPSFVFEAMKVVMVLARAARLLAKPCPACLVNLHDRCSGPECGCTATLGCGKPPDDHQERSNG
jgi:hypothetical protein